VRGDHDIFFLGCFLVDQLCTLSPSPSSHCVIHKMPCKELAKKLGSLFRFVNATPWAWEYQVFWLAPGTSTILFLYYVIYCHYFLTPFHQPVGKVLTSAGDHVWSLEGAEKKQAPRLNHIHFPTLKYPGWSFCSSSENISLFWKKKIVRHTRVSHVTASCGL